MRKSLFVAASALLILSCQNAPKKDGAKEAVTKTEAVEVKEEVSMALYSELDSYIVEAQKDIPAIAEERKAELKKIADYVSAKRKAGEEVNLTFICTHNSRRSHLSQIWAATAAAHYGVAEGVHTYSGGTESTAFNPRAVAAVERAGFQVANPGGENPHYSVSISEGLPAMECFSKKYDDPFNANEDFVAVMTCSSADKNCPLIPGAALRVAIPYEDPKVADNTDGEAAKYDERCRQIASEMLYMMSQVSI